MKIPLLVILLALSFFSMAGDHGNDSFRKRYIDFIVSKDVYEQYPDAIVKYKLFKLINYGNEFFKKHDINIVNVVNSIEQSSVSSNASMNIDDISSSIIDPELKSRIVNNTKHGIYTVLVVNTDEKYSGCGQANQKIGVAAINFDLVGGCSPDFILSHELGHLDGLRHAGNMGGGMCLDGTNSLMSSGIDGQRFHLFGSPKCNGKELLHTPYSYYKSIKPSAIYSEIKQVKPSSVNVAEKVDTLSYRIKGLTLSLYVGQTTINGQFYIAIPSSTENLVNETKLIKANREKDVISAKLSIEDRKNLIQSGVKYSLFRVEH